MHTQPKYLEPLALHRPMTTQAQNLELVKRQAANFVGYTYVSSEWQSLTCIPGYTYTESKPFGLNNPGYGGCCTTTVNGCYPWTSCTLGTLYGGAGSAPCGLGSSCVSGIVATSQGAELDGDLDFFCGTIGDWIVYRTPPSVPPNTTSPPTTTTSGPPTTTTSGPPTTTTSGPPTTTTSGPPTTTTSGPPTTTTSGPSTTTTSGPSKNTTTSATATHTTPLSSSNVSGAAIAGAVVGPICGVALLLGLLFIFLRQRRSKPPAAEVFSNTQPPPSGPIAPFRGYIAGKPELNAVNTPNLHHPVSIPPAYPGAENVETTVAMQDMPSPTMSHGTEVGAHSPVPIRQQSGAQVHQQIQSRQVPARRPVMAELGLNPPVTGMPPELPESTGYWGV